MMKIAMFDEVNEGTAIFKAVSPRDKAPKPGYWLTLDADGNITDPGRIIASERREPSEP